MNETNKGICIFIVVIILFVCAGFGAGYWFGSHVIGRTNTGNSAGVEFNLDRERELLERIGEYELRERDRIAAENSRIDRERERVERTKAQLGAIRKLDRRSSNLLQELEQEANILADYFRDSCDIINNELDTTGSE
jgi:flagellar basal body-associated protein FliL